MNWLKHSLLLVSLMLCLQSCSKEEDRPEIKVVYHVTILDGYGKVVKHWQNVTLKYHSGSCIRFDDENGKDVIVNGIYLAEEDFYRPKK